MSECLMYVHGYWSGQAVPLTCTSHVSANEPCYLDRPEWVAVYKSLSQEAGVMTDRSPLAIQLRAAMFPMPRLWHDLHKSVNEIDFELGKSASDLQERCRRLHRDMTQWLDDYNAYCVRNSFRQPPQSEVDVRRILFGTAIESLVLANRFWATVCDDDNPSRETETQAFARLLIELQKEGAPGYSWLLCGHEAGVAKVTLETAKPWEQTLTGMTICEKRAIHRANYNTWNKALSKNTLVQLFRDRY